MVVYPGCSSSQGCFRNVRIPFVHLAALSVIVDFASAMKLETVITSDGISQRRAFGQNRFTKKASRSTGSELRNYSDAFFNDIEAVANHTKSKAHRIAFEIAKTSSKHGDSAVQNHKEARVVQHSVQSKNHTVAVEMAESSTEHSHSAIRERDEASAVVHDTAVLANAEKLSDYFHSAIGGRRAALFSQGMYTTISFLGLFWIGVFCFCFGYGYAMQGQETEDDISGSSSDETGENRIRTLIPRKPKDTAKDLGLLAWIPATSANDRISEGPPHYLKMIDPEWTAANVHEILKTYGIPVTKWTDSALIDLARELGNCKARLFRKDDTLMRVVDIVIVIVAHKDEGTVIQEMSHPPYRRGFATIKERTPKGRMDFNESITSCAKRCLREKLQAPDGMIENLELDVLSIAEKIESLDFMPGLASIVRNYVVQVDVSKTDPKDLETIGGPHGRLEIKGYRYAWMKAEEVTNLRKHMKKQSSRNMALQKVVLDASAEPVLAWSEGEILSHLADAGIRREEAEHLWNVDLKKLVEHLRNGQLSLARGESDSLLCVEDTVILCARSKDDMVLVQSKTNKKMEKRELPSIRKLANESAWSASFRMAFLHLGIMSPSFHMSEDIIGPVRREVVRGRIKRGFIARAHIDEHVPQTLASFLGADANAEANTADDDDTSDDALDG